MPQDVSPFIEQYGQFRTSQLPQATSGSSQGSGNNSGPAIEPSGYNKMTSPPGAGGSKDAPKVVTTKKPDASSGNGAGPYLAGIAGLLAGGAGSAALYKYLTRGGAQVPPSEDISFPATAHPGNVASGQVPDAVTRPNWRTVAPEKGGLPAVIPPQAVKPYMPPANEVANPEVIDAITRLLK